MILLHTQSLNPSAPQALPRVHKAESKVWIKKLCKHTTFWKWQKKEKADSARSLGPS